MSTPQTIAFAFWVTSVIAAVILIFVIVGKINKNQFDKSGRLFPYLWADIILMWIFCALQFTL